VLCALRLAGPKQLQKEQKQKQLLEADSAVELFFFAELFIFSL
jgi:hypothetical protein